MKNFLCWRPSGVLDVINPEAEVVSPRIFRAVHSPCDLRVSGPVGTSFQSIQPEHYRPLTQEELLEDFLKPDAPYRRMAVFGRSGSGKSHLIHWLKINIPSTRERTVVVVPKTGTSLRSILEMLIAELPAEQQVGFREALNRTGESVSTRIGQKKRLLNEIAIAIGEREARGESPDPDLERELIRVLPHLFNDVHFREKYFEQDGNIVADLVDHVFAAPTAYRPVDQRRSFTLSDLPVDILDLKDAAAQARHALQYLHSIPAAPQIAVDLVNASLDLAVARTLSFTGDRLVSLMEDLRRHLRREGRELVLLIEDFARVQGLDRALLQAMIVQGGGPDDDLCRLRWAIAVTTGFFEQVIDTVYTRISHFVNMDRSSGRRGESRMERGALSDFAGPYLNAVRLGTERLREQEADVVSAVANACTGCPHRTICHETFGASRQGYGLYPFTTRALWIMAHRVDESVEEAFNPRTLQTGVLIPTLEGAGSSIELGTFPPPGLLTQLGGDQSLGSEERIELRRRVGAEEGRMKTLLELWDGSGKIVNLPAALLTAFDAPTITDVATGDLDEDKNDDGGRNDEGRALARVADTRTVEEKEVEAWAKGRPLDRAVNKLRPLVYDAIADGIDWDALGLERARFCSTEEARAFRRRSINFARQGVSTIRSPVMLEIPRRDALQAEFDRAAVALSGLLKATRLGHWDFPGGTNALQTYLDCLEEWQAEVAQQVRSLVAPGDAWDSAAAATELLALGCAINGSVKAEADLTSDLAAVLEEEWPTDIAAMSVELRQLYETLRKAQPELRRLLRSICSAAKGGEVGALINPRVALAALKQLRANGWTLSQQPPADLTYEPARKCAEVYLKVKAALQAAAEAERDLRLAWLSEMESTFGQARRAAIMSGLAEAREAVVDAGLGGGAAQRLGEALEEFGRVQYDAVVDATRALQTTTQALDSLPAYARGRGGAIAAARRLATAAGSFLTQSRTYLHERGAQQSAQEQEATAHIEAIERSLENIARHLGAEESVNAA